MDESFFKDAAHTRSLVELADRLIRESDDVIARARDESELVTRLVTSSQAHCRQSGRLFNQIGGAAESDPYFDPSEA